MILLSCPSFLLALPQGENVVSGAASFDRAADTLTVNTASDKLIVNYSSFNIAAQETVRFQQPSAGSVVLNRVVGVDPSSIMGTMQANGQVFLVNPNGIVFGAGSRVDVAGLIASTLDISNEDFLAGRYVFNKGVSNGYVINQGDIIARQGYVCLLGGAVDNQMMIQADLGTVALAAGEKITVALENNNIISVVVDEAVSSEVFGPDAEKMDSAVKNSGSILAEGGKVILTAKVLNKVFDHAINNTGLVKVTSLVEHDGVIELVAEGAEVVNSGTLEAPVINIEVENAGITNTASGVISADATAQTANAGSIFLNAATILQEGLISANIEEEGTAGDITIVSETSTVLDTGSRTEAQAAGLVGNGGSIKIDSRNGNTFVNKDALIDFSAGSVAGNGGSLYIGAFEQLGFYGILNGRAPPGFTPGKAILDPLLSFISGEFSSGTVIYSPNDIHIVGNIVVSGTYGYEGHFAILADHTSEDFGSWDDGQGAIINDGDYSIQFQGLEGPELILMAGSGIGSISAPISCDAYSLTAVINPASSEGDIFIDNLGSVYVREINSPGLVVLTATGQIRDDSEEGPAITADELYIESEGGIGEYYYYQQEYYYPLYINVRNLAALNEGYGGIYIENYSDNLNILAISNPQGEDVDVYSAGDIRVIYGIEAAWNIDLVAANNIYISDFASLVTDLYEGSVYLTAGGSISRIPESGLLAYWNFDGEDDSSYSVYDQVTGAYASVYGYPSLVEGGVGGSTAMSFDGINDYINTYRYFNLGTGPFTLVVWYQGTQTSPYIGLVGATPGLEVGYALENHNGYARYWLSQEIADSAVAINDGLPHLIAMVRDGAEGSIYIVSEEEGEGVAPDVYFTDFTVPADSVNSSTPFWIGGWGVMLGADGRPRLTQGLMDDIRVYNRALSGLEIYAQTLVAPGQGRINAAYVELDAQTGVDMGLGSVDWFYVSNTSGNINIDSLSDLYIEEGTFDNHGYTTITTGDISLSSAGSIYVNEDIFTIGPNDLTLTADGDIVIAGQVNVYSDSSYGDQSLSNAVAGDITLNAGADIILGYNAGVTSYAYGYSYEGYSLGESGDIRLTAGNNITLDRGNIYSDASAYGYYSCTAYSGDVVLDAGNNITETGFGDLIYSSADANVYEAENSSAYAQSGMVSLSAGNSLTIDGRDPENTYGASVYSFAQAYAGYSAVAYSSSVLLSTDYGDITLYRTELYSDVDTRTYTSGIAGSLSQAISGDDYYDYNNYEWSYLAVMLDAGDSIFLNDSTTVYGAASAQGDASYSYARSGDVTLDAWYGITLADHVYSDAISTAEDISEAISGKANVVSYYGTLTVPVTSLIWSNATADVVNEGASAYATSDDVTVRSWYGPVTLDQAASSTAEAYGDYMISPALLQAITGDVEVYAGGDLEVNSYVYAHASTSSDNALTLRLTSGDVSLYGANIYLNDGRVYSGPNDQEGYDTALNDVYTISGDVSFFSEGDIVISGDAQITTWATARCPVGDVPGLRAYATSGGIYLIAYYGDIVFGSQAAQVDSLIRSYSAAFGAAENDPVPGPISLQAGGSIYLWPTGYDYYGYPVESVAAIVNEEQEYPGDLSLVAMRDITLSQDLRADTISILADADWSGEGSIIQNADNLTLYARRFNLSGAQDLALDSGDGVYLTGEGLQIELNMYSQSNPAFAIASTFSNEEAESFLSVNDMYYEGYDYEYLRFYSAGDLEIYDDLYASEIELVADCNEDGYGDLYTDGQVYLGAESHYLQTASDIMLIGNDVYEGEIFHAALINEGPLGDLAVRSTSGSVTIEEIEGDELVRTGNANIEIRAAGDVVLNAPVSVETGGLYLISDEGSILAGPGEFTHITAASDVYLRAGNEDTVDGTNVVGTLQAPLNIMVTGGGEVGVEVYGQLIDEETGTGVSGNLVGEVNGSTQSDAVEVLNNAPGVVYFNNAPAPEPVEPPEPPEPPYEPPIVPGPEPQPVEEIPPAPVENIMFYIYNPPDAESLIVFQINSAIGPVYFYHPITPTDMQAFDIFSVGADAYQLLDGQLKLIGHEGLLDFFREFEKKRGQL